MTHKTPAPNPPSPEEVKSALQDILRNAAKSQPTPANAEKPEVPTKEGK